MGYILLAGSLAATKSSGGSPYTLIIILVLIFGIFYFLMIRPQRNRQRQVMQVQDTVVPGQWVRTTAGMYGTVSAVEDGDVVIEVAPGVEVRLLKRAIMDVLSEPPGSNGSRPATDGETHDSAYAEDSSTPPAGERADRADQARDGQATENYRTE